VLRTLDHLPGVPDLQVQRLHAIIDAPHLPAPRRRRPVAAAQDPPHGRLADAVAETSQVRRVPCGTPGRVLPREPQPARCC